MALSDGPILDAQAGAETFGSALIAALAGVNSVSGPGMLDFLLVFSLPKLVFDDEMCGQALRFVREVKPLDDLPVGALIDQLMADQHLIMAPHTTTHWPERAVPAQRRSSIATTARRGCGPVARTPTSAPATRSTDGSPRTASSRPTRRSTPSCGRSSGPAWSLRQICRSSRSRPSPCSRTVPVPANDATTDAANAARADPSQTQQ